METNFSMDYVSQQCKINGHFKNKHEKKKLLGVIGGYVFCWVKWCVQNNESLPL